MNRALGTTGAALCLTAVLLGAFGAHALAEVLASHARTDTYELANRYHFYHGLALLAMAAFKNDDGDRFRGITIIM